MLKRYELIQISEKCWYINCPAKIGVCVPDKDHVYLSMLLWQKRQKKI